MSTDGLWFLVSILWFLVSDFWSLVSGCEVKNFLSDNCTLKQITKYNTEGNYGVKARLMTDDQLLVGVSLTSWTLLIDLIWGQSDLFCHH